MESGHGRTWVRGKLIGKGGFGSVYLATAKKTKSPNGYFPPVMAVKSAEISVSGSLQKEKEILVNLSECPNVLRCFGEETTDGSNGHMIYNVLLEYASGGTLARLIRNSCNGEEGGEGGGRVGGGLLEPEVKRYAKSMLEGIFQVHECGYVHCDLKPDNILLVPCSKTTITTTAATSSISSSDSSSSAVQFIAKIGDFGLAKRARRNNKKQKLDPYLRGTSMYMAPETVADYVQEPPSDIWALGCIVLEMLTGKPPWDMNSDDKTDHLLSLIKHPHQSPTLPIGISKEARDFLKGCLVRNPKFRLTAEMLIDHPFLSGVDCGQGQESDEIDQHTEEFADITNSSSSCSSFEDYPYVLSGDWSSHEDGSDLSSCSSSSEEEDVEEIEEFENPIDESRTSVQKRKRISSNYIAIDDADRLINNTKPKPPSKIIQKFSVPTIRAGI